MYDENKTKNILVTGGTRGIGAAIVKEFISKGYSVFYTGTTENDSNENYIQCDFLNEDSLFQFKEKISKLNIDILINNAGINKIGDFENYEKKNFNKLIKVNITTPFELCQCVLPNMKKKQWGRIVNITSIFGKISKEFRAAYSCTKFGLDGMTLALAAEVASQGILANCVAPGFIDTDLTHQVLGEEGITKLSQEIPMKRLGQPHEIAKLVAWLCSEENTYLTGQNIAIDGGFSRV